MALTVNTILDKLKSDMEDKIDPAGNYSKRPIIKHGYYTESELKADLPAVCFACLGEEFDMSISDDILVYINIRMYGYANSDGIDSKDDIKELAHDVLHFLHSSDFTYVDDQWLVSDVLYVESSPPENTVGEFVFDIKIKYETTYTTLRD